MGRINEVARQPSERQPKGRRREPNAAAALAKENERLKRDLGRQQTLVRLAQRSVGLSPSAPSTSLLAHEDR